MNAHGTLQAIFKHPDAAVGILAALLITVAILTLLSYLEHR